MKLAAVTSIVQGSGAVGFGCWWYWSAHGVGSSAVAVLLGLALLGGGVASLNRLKAAYACTALSFLITVFFAAHFLATEAIFPGGILLIASFMALFLVLLGLFLQLRQEDLRQ